MQETIRAVKEMRVLIYPEFSDMIQQLKVVQGRDTLLLAGNAI